MIIRFTVEKWNYLLRSRNEDSKNIEIRKRKDFQEWLIHIKTQRVITTNKLRL